jgi:hypothetical protein
MKLKLFENSKKEINQKILTIGKGGFVRFKTNHPAEFKLVKNEIVQFALDTDEKPIKHIYIIRPNQKVFGWKIQNLNGRLLIDAKEFFSKTNIQLPVKCNIESFKQDSIQGLKLTIIKN